MLVLFVTSCCAVGQVTADDPLYKEIMRGDSLIFEVAFNDCQVEALYEVSEDDFEFYHDQGGFTSGQKSFVQSMKNNICALDYRPYRKLNLESLEIHPLNSNGQLYGALQMGVHDFYAIKEGEETKLTSTARFTHLWLLKEGRWVISRVMSYDHKSP